MHIANCSVDIDTYLSLKIQKKNDIQDMCETISHAVNAACSFKYKLCFVLKWTSGTKSIHVYERNVK